LSKNSPKSKGITPRETPEYRLSQLAVAVSWATVKAPKIATTLK